MPEQPPSLTEDEIQEAVARCPEYLRTVFEGWLRGTHELDGERIDEGEPDMDQQVATANRHVKVWFGEHVIAQYVAEPELAERYAVAMARRFAGLRVTNEQVLKPGSPGRPLPSERLWGNDPH